MCFRFLRFLAGLSLPLVLTQCTDQELVERVDRLEAELRSVRSDTREEVAGLRNRVIDAETDLGESVSDVPFATRLEQAERAMKNLVAQKSQDSSTVTLSRTMQGHAPLRTDHGTLLARMGDIQIALQREGFLVTVELGNPHAMSISDFTLTGKFGGATPVLEEGEVYSLENEKLAKWEASLGEFEQRFSVNLEPMSWTKIQIFVPAPDRDEIEMLRFSLMVHQSDLTPPPLSKFEEAAQFAQLEAGASGARVFRTDYGAFLVRVMRVEAAGTGSRVHLELGNPYGFIIDGARLVGNVAPSRPRRQADESPSVYAQRMQEWSARLTPFEAAIAGSLQKNRWSKVTAQVPLPPQQAQFFYCQLQLDEVSLPEAK